MFDTASFGHGDLVRDDIHPRVDLHRIRIDDPRAIVRVILTISGQGEGKFNTELRLAYTRRPADDNERFRGHACGHDE